MAGIDHDALWEALHEKAAHVCHLIATVALVVVGQDRPSRDKHDHLGKQFTIPCNYYCSLVVALPPFSQLTSAANSKLRKSKPHSPDPEVVPPALGLGELAGSPDVHFPELFPRPRRPFPPSVDAPRQIQTYSLQTHRGRTVSLGTNSFRCQHFELTPTQDHCRDWTLTRTTKRHPRAEHIGTSGHSHSRVYIGVLVLHVQILNEMHMSGLLLVICNTKVPSFNQRPHNQNALPSCNSPFATFPPRWPGCLHHTTLSAVYDI